MAQIFVIKASGVAVPVTPGGSVSAISDAGSFTLAVPVGQLTGLGTGVGTALAVNIGSAGAPLLFNGAGGTPSSLALANATGLLAAGASVAQAGFQSVFAYQNAVQNIASGADRQINYNTELRDSAGTFASSTFTPVALGWYRITMSVRFASTNQTRLILYKNGSAFEVMGDAYIGAGTYATIGSSILVEVTNAADNFKGYAEVGVTQDTVVITGHETRFIAERIP